MRQRQSMRIPRVLNSNYRVVFDIPKLKVKLAAFGSFTLGNYVSYDVMALQKFSGEFHNILDSHECCPLVACLFFHTYVKSVEEWSRKQIDCIVTDPIAIAKALDNDSVTSCLQILDEKFLSRLASKAAKDKRILKSSIVVDTQKKLISPSVLSKECSIHSLCALGSDDDDFIHDANYLKNNIGPSVTTSLVSSG